MPTLTKRKLIAMGDGGLVVTVPKAWRDFYGLRAGDVVIVVADGELLIRPLTEHRDEVRDQANGKSQDTD